MEAPPLRIELLFFDGCPHYRRVWSDLLDVVAEARLDVAVRPIEIRDPEQAAALSFAGSPTVLVEGRDLEDRCGPGVMACRVYRENGNLGWPGRDLLRRRLEAADRIHRDGSSSRGDDP